MDNGYGMQTSVKLTVSLSVKRDLYFGHLPVPKISGFKDEFSGMVITNAFEIGLLEADDVERNWIKIDKEADAPVRPVISLIGSVMWDNGTGQEIRAMPE